MPHAFDPQCVERSVFDALIDASRRYGQAKPILEDQERSPLSYLDLIRAAFALGRKLEPLTTKAERVGVLLPSSAGVVVTFFALHAFGRTPTMLNFTAGERSLVAACRGAGVKRILTAKRFIDQAKLEPLVEALSVVAEITYLEDVRKSITTADKLFAAAGGAAPRLFRAKVRPDDPGVVLFTSGSFGAPKGVVLTNRNLVANACQVGAHIDLDPAWVSFNPLPTFHCFGLTAGVILPLLNGLKAVQYPSPLHAKTICDLIKDVDADILFATDTFVNQYARQASPEQLSGLNFIVCGAEKVRDETHAVFADKFGGVMVLEGYGATETAPVIAVNQPDHNVKGTVGRLLPGQETRLEPVAGIDGGGRLFVRGPNVMAGYLDPETGRLDAPPEGWHDTGDVVDISDDSVVRILGRAKRFAKIGGEMVSLLAVEELVAQIWPEARHAVVAMPDSRKGERLVLVTDNAGAEVVSLVEHAKRVGAPELAVPKKILKVAEVPLLGTGKTDYATVQQLAEEQLKAA